MKGETLPEYLGCTEQMMTVPDQDGCDQLVNDGGDAALLIHKGKCILQLLKETPSRQTRPSTQG